jgi:hypothetical protein
MLLQIATEGSRGQSVGFLSLSMVVGSLLAVLSFYALEVSTVCHSAYSCNVGSRTVDCTAFWQLHSPLTDTSTIGA